MSIQICDYNFDGPYPTTSSIENKSGVYVILCKNDNEKYDVIDVGESSEVKDRLDKHDRKSCWEEQCADIYYAVYYTSHEKQSGRKEIESEIRKQYNPPCGER